METAIITAETLQLVSLVLKGLSVLWGGCFDAAAALIAPAHSVQKEKSKPLNKPQTLNPKP